MPKAEVVEALAFVGTVTAIVVTAITLFGGWGYAIHEYGWFLGLAFGWIPSAIIAAMVFGVLWLLFIIIPEKAPSLVFVSCAAVIACDLALLASFIFVGFWVLRFFGLLMR